MDTQNTPIHVKLWHREFWLMAIANLLLTMSVYMLIPVLPKHLADTGFNFQQIALSMGVFGIGVFTFGGFSNHLIQKYRRNKVCLYAIFGLLLSVGGLYEQGELLGNRVEFWMVLVVRFLMGAFYGLAQIVLSSTLVIDTCESFQRTEANHAASWFSRFALSLAPVYALAVQDMFSYGAVLLASAICCVLSFLMIRMVNFPFKAPDENVKVWSVDRFYLTQGTPLFISLVVITVIMGLVYSIANSAQFYCMLMSGFIIALLAERYVFANAELKSEVVTGLIVISAALLLALTRHMHIVNYIVPAFGGFGLGIIGSRYLLFFIKLARHCQRGTSLSSFFLAWELGISIGICVGYLIHDIYQTEYLALVIALVMLPVYNFLIHPWYLKHKNR